MSTTNHNSNTTGMPSEPIRELLRAVARRDRQRLAGTRDLATYTRPYEPGEAWPQQPDCRFVMVARHPNNPSVRIVIALGEDTDAVWPQFDYDRLAGTAAEQAAYDRVREDVARLDALARAPEAWV